MHNLNNGLFTMLYGYVSQTYLYDYLSAPEPLKVSHNLNYNDGIGATDGVSYLPLLPKLYRRGQWRSIAYF